MMAFAAYMHNYHEEDAEEAYMKLRQAEKANEDLKKKLAGKVQNKKGAKANSSTSHQHLPAARGMPHPHHAHATTSVPPNAIGPSDVYETRQQC